MLKVSKLCHFAKLHNPPHKIRRYLEKKSLSWNDTNRNEHSERKKSPPVQVRLVWMFPFNLKGTGDLAIDFSESQRNYYFPVAILRHEFCSSHNWLFPRSHIFHISVWFLWYWTSQKQNKPTKPKLRHLALKEGFFLFLNLKSKYLFPFLLDVLLSRACPCPGRELPAPWGQVSSVGPAGRDGHTAASWDRSSSQGGDVQNCCQRPAHLRLCLETDLSTPAAVRRLENS